MLPKYQKIAQDITLQIEDHTYNAMDFLPSEKELMSIHDSSRDTIRKALSILQDQGYIQKVVGKGSMVLDVDRVAFPVSGISSFKELKATMSGDISTIVYSVEKLEANEELKKHLYIDEGYVYNVIRSRSINGERVILDIDYLNAQIVPGITEEIAQDSLYEYIEEVLGLEISFSRKEITVLPASDEDRKYLDMGEYDLVVCVKSYSYLEDATLFEYTISKHRPDKFRFVDFARRMK